MLNLPDMSLPNQWAYNINPDTGLPWDMLPMGSATPSAQMEPPKPGGAAQAAAALHRQGPSNAVTPGVGTGPAMMEDQDYLPEPVPGSPPTTMTEDATSKKVDADKSKDYYNYALLASLAATAGAGIGQAFRYPRHFPPPVPPQYKPKPDVTAPSSVQSLVNMRLGRQQNNKRLY